MAQVTPMMQCYLDTKEKYKDCILFYRLGDFYEMFFDDDITASKELELTLTGKDCGLEERAPMCGIPHHAKDTYITKLVEKGYKVAICEQLEDPKYAKGIVKRDVVKIVTPGTITDLTMLDEKKNNYIASIYMDKKECAISFCDVSTGEFFISSIGGVDVNTKILNEISRIAPSEVILSDATRQNSIFFREFNKIFNIYTSSYNNDEKNKFLDDIVQKHNVTLTKLEEEAATLLINYIEETQKGSIEQINNIIKYEIEKYMQLDTSTRKNLEILEANREHTKKGSLLWVLDETVTAMGGRALRHWLESPLLNKEEIIKRQDAVGVLVDSNMFRDELKETLKTVYDIERLISKVVGGSVNARELTSLKNSLSRLPELKKLLKEIVDKTGNEYFTEFYNTLSNMLR